MLFAVHSKLLTIDSGTVTPAKTDFVGTLTEGKWCTVSVYDDFI